MLDLIVNPTAGGKHGKKMVNYLKQIEHRLNQRNITYTIHRTNFKGEAKKLTEELNKNGATDIICVGGDGTLHEVINGFSDFSKTNLGILPCGTGNDFASALNIPKDMAKAVDLILDGKPQYTDFLQLPTIRAINIVGMGIDVDVLKKYEALKKKTKLGYTTCLVRTLCKFDYSDFTAKLNGKEEKYRSFIACVANGNRYGGGIPICPPADPTDGFLDFSAVKEMSKLKIIKAFIKLKKGKIMTLKESCHERAKEISIISPVPYTVNADGELYNNIPFDVKIVSNELKVYRY